MRSFIKQEDEYLPFEMDGQLVEALMQGGTEGRMNSVREEGK